MYYFTVGKFTQKAPNWLVYLVLSCTIITVGLLYTMEKSEQLADRLTYQSSYQD